MAEFDMPIRWLGRKLRGKLPGAPLRIQSPCQMMIGVLLLPQQGMYVPVSILSFGDWIPRGWKQVHSQSTVAPGNGYGWFR